MVKLCDTHFYHVFKRQNISHLCMDFSKCTLVVYSLTKSTFCDISKLRPDTLRPCVFKCVCVYNMYRIM